VVCIAETGKNSNDFGETRLRVEEDKPISTAKPERKPRPIKEKPVDPKKAKISVGIYTLISCFALIVVLIIVDIVFSLNNIVKSDLLSNVFEFAKSVVLIVLGYFFSKEIDK